MRLGRSMRAGSQSRPGSWIRTRTRRARCSRIRSTPTASGRGSRPRSSRSTASRTRRCRARTTSCTGVTSPACWASRPWMSIPQPSLRFGRRSTGGSPSTSRTSFRMALFGSKRSASMTGHWSVSRSPTPRGCCAKGSRTARSACPAGSTTTRAPGATPTSSSRLRASCARWAASTSSSCGIGDQRERTPMGEWRRRWRSAADPAPECILLTTARTRPRPAVQRR